MHASVVMPTLNQRAFIDEAIRSVMAQESVQELVVVDGGSRDGTQSDLATFAAAFPGRLRWRSLPDAGPAQAVNRALAMARGELIGWLNSDDLYAPGAVERAIAEFLAHPGHVMIYGHGEHIDVAGRTIGRYPTQPPSTPTADFAHGCFICQPTAFFRRAAFDRLGGLDESLRAAFDFDLWIRFFASFPGRVGFVQSVQAMSRLHAGSITVSQRERVAIEGMVVIRRHLGPAPPEWLLTHFAERCQAHPFDTAPTDLRADFGRLIDRATPFLSGDGVQRLRQHVATDKALQLATASVFAAVYPDGWAPSVLEIRVRQPDPPASRISLRCRHARPGGGALRLTVSTPHGECLSHAVPANGPFEWCIPLSGYGAGERVVLRVTADASFVPAQCETGSIDGRELAFLLESMNLAS